MMSLARLALQEHQHIVVARLDGEVDVGNARELYDRLADAMTSDVPGLVVDLSGVAYLDSAGVGLLFALAKQLQRHERELRIVVPDDSPIRRVLLIVNMDTHVPLHATVAEALEGIRDAGQGAMPHGTMR
jgi:anti-sigma B factor antagonist